ncbi:MAG: beta-phosphoglucomutase [SAR324 cluster bacterium]|uniref:Beta-phosphoglucomutase n=1 Tax=SAR324 cluster bacterium TaxID=2024889 RepID=A0A7X9IJT9_9DELT|nr:beta-phosphoglucomutase [SAR324 cluster bacterium]
MIKGVIFDLDGVLVSTDEYHYLGWKRVSEEEGFPFDRELNHRLRGVSRMESLDIILEAAGMQLERAEKEIIAARKNGYYREYLESIDKAALLPGAEEILHELIRLGIKRAIASSSKNARLIVERTGILDLVDEIADGNDINESKPSPEVFLIAAKRLCLDASECLVVEDAEAGVEAGLRAGMKVLGIGSRDMLKNAHLVVENLSKITVGRMLSI